MEQARIYRPTKSTMQSGKARSKPWRLEMVVEDAPFIEPVMGWIGSKNMYSAEFRLNFATKEEAISYAVRHKLKYEVVEPKEQKLKIQAYSDNFKYTV
jgi:hypothetical protein